MSAELQSAMEQSRSQFWAYALSAALVVAGIILLPEKKGYDPDYRLVLVLAFFGALLTLCWSAMPVPITGVSSIAVVRKIVFRPPARRMKNDDGMRIVAPDRPEIAVSVNSSSFVKGKPRLSICTEMIPHIAHTAKPQYKAGIDIHRLR